MPIMSGAITVNRCVSVGQIGCPVKGIERVAVDQQQRRTAALHPVEDVEAEVVEVQSVVQPGSQASVHDLRPPYAM